MLHRKEFNNDEKQKMSDKLKRFTRICKFTIIIIFSIFVIVSILKISKLKLTQTQLLKILEEYEIINNQTINELTSLRNRNRSQLGQQNREKYQLLKKKLASLDNIVWGKSQKNVNESIVLSSEIERYQNEIEQKQIVDYLLINQIKQIERVKRLQLIKTILENRHYEEDKILKGIKLLGLNIKSEYVDPVYKKQMNSILKSETQRLQKSYFINLAQELPICVVVLTSNNVKDHRFQYNLQSIINQQYSNYKIILIDDGSTDETWIYAKLFLKRSKISAEKYFLIKNGKQSSDTASIYYGIKEYCEKEDIVILMKGKDQLISKNTFKTISTFYHNSNSQVIFINYFTLHQNSTLSVHPHPLTQFTMSNIQQNKYRQIQIEKGCPITFLFRLFNKINQQDMRSNDGYWLSTNNYEVFIYPMLEMACGRFQIIDEFLYLQYQKQTQVDPSVEQHMKILRKKNPYQCLPGYKILK